MKRCSEDCVEDCINKQGQCHIRKRYDGMCYRVSLGMATMCDEWNDDFLVFRAWMIKQDWRGKELDKDLIGKKRQYYSPETCLFLTKDLNHLVSSIMLPTSIHGEPKRYLRGVTQRKSGWKVRCNAKIKSLDIKEITSILYPSELQAHIAWCHVTAEYLLKRAEISITDITLLKHFYSFVEDTHQLKFLSEEDIKASYERAKETPEECKTLDAEYSKNLQERKAARKAEKQARFDARQFTITTDDDEKGEITGTVTKLCKHFNKKPQTVRAQIKRGMSLDEALKTSANSKRIARAKPRSWTEDECITEAQEYKTAGEWKKHSRGSYNAALRLGINKECKAHMKRYVPVSKWTKEAIVDSASPFNDVQKWKKAYPCAVKNAKKIGIYDQVTSHMHKNQNQSESNN